MLKICKKTGILLVSVMILMFAMTVFADQTPDYDDPDYVKRMLTAEKADEDEISSNGSSGQKSAFTGSTYTHANIYTSGDYEILQGVDVSKWLEDINWKKVKNAGISFAFIRIGYTGMSSSFSRNKDRYYSQNLKEAKAAGVKVGVYYFSQAITESEAKKEANYTLELLDGAELDYPVVFDMEALSGGRLYNAIKKGKISKTQAVKICQAYCNVIADAGYDVILYMNRDHLENVFNAKSLLANFDNFWYARYSTIAHRSSECSSYQKNGQISLESFFHDGKYMFWQYTEKGDVPGISYPADCNFQYVKKSDQEEETTAEETAEETTAEETTAEETTEEETEAIGDDPEWNPSKVTGLASASVSTSSVELTWEAVTEADSYEIWRSEACDGTYKFLAAVTGTSYTDQELSECREYYYRVRAKRSVDGVAYVGSYSSVRVGRTKMAASAQVKMTENAAIYKKAGTAYEELATAVKGEKLTLKSVTKDKDGVFWFRVETSSGVIGYVSSEYAVNVVKKVTSVKAADRKSTGVTISWKAQSAVTGYQIYRSSAKNGTYKKIATVKDQTTYTDSGLSKYCQYYYKIRAYSKRNGVVTYGSFSSVKEIATKATSFKAKTTGSVYVRQCAGTAYKKLTVLKKGKQVKVTLRTKDKNGKWWYKVSVKNGNKIYKGYIRAVYLKKVK